MEVQQAVSSPQQFRFEEPAVPQATSTAQGIIVTSAAENAGMTVNAQVTVSSAKDHFALASNKAIDLIGEEFVTKLKAEPDQDEERPTVVMNSGGGTAVETTTVMAGGDQSHLVYCNLNDLDLSSNNETYSLASLHSLAEASSSVHQQQERNPYSAVPTILLQGGILQLKPESSGGPEVQGGQDQVLMTVGSSGSKMVPTQVVSVAGSLNHTRAQDNIVNILASMNSQNIETSVSSAGTINYAGGVHDVDEAVVALDPQHFEQERQEVLPLNLATTTPSQGTVIQSSQLQGIKRLNQPSQSPAGLVTKKVIIATINGTQRILTPVSSPQIIAMKAGSRLISDGTVVNGTSPIIIQKPVTQINKPKQLNSPVVNPRSTDNKTCLWKFENGQVCGKVFTKTYNLTVHMRMHQDIRPFPCTICEQTFRQKAHLQRHEATHGIDSTANRKRRKRPMMEEMQELSKRAGTESDEELYRPFTEKRKFSLGTMKTEEEELDVDPMIEPIDGSQIEKKMVCPVNVGTNTEVPPHDVSDEIEESTLEPVRYRNNHVSKGVEQGVQYSEEDLIIPESTYQEYGRTDESIDTKDIVRYVEPSKAVLKTETSSDEDAVTTVAVGEDPVYASQHYVTGQEIATADGQLIATQTPDGSYIDTSSNQIVMSHDGELVGFVPVEGDQSQVVNISTTTNEHGQQVVIIENLHHHSPELQREIMNALISESNLVPLSQS